MFCGEASCPRKGTSAIGSCVKPTPDTSTLNWANAGTTGELARAATRVRRVKNDEEGVALVAFNGLIMQFGGVCGEKVSPQRTGPQWYTLLQRTRHKTCMWRSGPTRWAPVESAAMQPSPAADTVARPPLTLLRRLARLMTWFGGSRRWWTVGVIAALTAALTEPLMPALVKPLLDHGFSGGGLELWMVPAAAISLFAVRGMAQFVSQYALARIANEGMHRLRRVLFARVMDAELAMFSRQSASSLSNTVVYEIQTGSMLLVQALLGLSRDGFTLVALLVYLIYLNWKLTLIVGLMVPGVAWVMKVFSKRLYHLTQLGQKTTDELAYVVEENVLAHRMVRLHGAESTQQSRFEGLS